jgi:atypical dual specificity phosphatase
MEAGDLMRKLYGVIFGHPMNVSPIDDDVYGSARPTSKKEVEWLVETKGIKAILSITETPLNPSLLGQISSYKQISVKNHHAPTLAQLDEAVNFVLKNKQEGRKTAVHCAAGKGRTGTVLAAYLCATEHLSGKEAIAKVRAERGGSVERNSGQEGAVVKYCDYIREQKKQ